MEIKVFQKHYNEENAAFDFLNVFYQKDMTYLASDLLPKGIPPDDIKRAVKKAIVSVNKTAINSKKHFQPVITEKNGTSFLDCRLSKLGFSLVLLNASPNSEYIAAFQVHMSQQFINTIQ